MPALTTKLVPVPPPGEAHSALSGPLSSAQTQTDTWVHVADDPHAPDTGAALDTNRPGPIGNFINCLACGGTHYQGYCPLKLAGAEYCNMCGLAHFGYSRTCAHLNSVTQLRAMNEALKQSTEAQDLKDSAKKKITGIIGDLNQRKRRAQEKKEAVQRTQSGVAQNTNSTASNQGSDGDREMMINSRRAQEKKERFQATNSTANKQIFGEKAENRRSQEKKGALPAAPSGVVQNTNGTAGNQFFDRGRRY